MSPFIANGTSWKVFRNVRDYGAKGDGRTDDAAAIQAAINDGGRGPGGNGFGTTGAPAVVYFPEGTYLMKSSVQSFVDTMLIGNPIQRPTLKVSPDFVGSTLLFMKDPSLDATINFFIVAKNLVLDSTGFPASKALTLVDWSLSQGTQLTNMLFRMPQNSQHTGVSTPEGGSGTFMGNLDFVGGLVGINMNNQQYNVKSCTFTGTTTGVLVSHGFALLFQDFTFTNVGTGINATTGGVGNVGSIALIDSTANSVQTVIATKPQNTVSTTLADDSIVIDNLQTNNVRDTVVAGGTTLLRGGVQRTWVYGRAYLRNGPPGGVHDNGVTYDSSRPSVLVTGGKFFVMAPPTYQDYSLQQVVNIKDVKGFPVHGDGQTDDTHNINLILAANAGRAVTFFPQGTYLVTDTIHVPPGSRIVGEAFSAISAVGPKFANANAPRPMVQVGLPGQRGVAQISDMLFTVADVLPGCILVEVNMAGNQNGDVGFWNSHMRVGGAMGSAVETKCQGGVPCKAAFMLLHVTRTASVYIEDMWGWTADHDLDGDFNQLISTGRGALVESVNGVWLVGTAMEHNTLYQYNLVGASNVFIGMQQCETVYWQGTGGPALAPFPWTPSQAYADPTFASCAEDDANCRMGWYQRIVGGSDLSVWSSGFWTFFNDVGACQAVNGTCQDNAVEIIGDPERLFWWNLNTRGVLNMLIDDGQVVETRNNNPGSWDAVVAASLTHSGLNGGGKMARDLVGGGRMRGMAWEK
ncbi:exo-beta-1,3-glucanase [Coniochaeta ligniaria NRRL 30616]|uniref:Exo-beta-1,3-glucanase n=1 Tax=Coniochaeta ligniaria NRRL 30616 TaxID=1408157 RepID=A0A1J7IZF3_9PEZI|nr:exo-beta-1,3-glucanase [Coniochaeta ligniaria NRRL 30616]